MNKVQSNFRGLYNLVDVHMEGENKLRYTGMLSALGADVEVDGKTYLGLKRCPAAKRNHHAFEGGLVKHMLEMWEIWLTLKNNHEFAKPPYVTDERVLAGIINHDLHKAYRTFVLVSEEPWSADYGDDKTDSLMGNDVKSLWILNQYGIRLDPEQVNALIWAEGGFAKIKSNSYSALAVMVASLDALSGSCLEKMRMGFYLDEQSRKRGHA